MVVELDKLIPAARSGEAVEAPRSMPLGGTRSQAMQRLQVGLTGFAVVVLLVGVANVVMDRARQSEASVVPQAASTVAPTEDAAPANDPLADAGVVPDLPTEPEATPSQPEAIMPEQGNAAPAPTQ